LNFTIEEQYPEGALRIDYHTGEISVANRNSFDYELYPIISGIVNVSNGNVSTSASITINLLDVAYNNTKFKGTDFIIIDDSAFNVPEIDFTNYMVDMIYEDNILERISYASHPNLNRYTGNIQINEINNNLITNFSEREFFHGFGCRANYTLTYDSFDRITNILVQVDICDSFTYNYNIEYIGNTVNFIDQINSNDKSMVLNDNNQILSYTSGSSTVDFTYDSNNNLISVLSGNKSITYEYDNYQNPYNFDGTFNLSLLINFSLVIQNNLSDEKMFNLYGNTNNITRIIRNNINDAMNVNYYYNYNEYNYPVSKTSDLFTETINYYYYD
jgi:YD repeat-containing protein